MDMKRDTKSASRREILKLGTGIAAMTFVPAAASAAGGWDEVPTILGRIKAPAFADRSFDVSRYGAAGDGKTDCSAAIAKAIAECNAADGGRVTFPAGVFFTGPIHLKSNVNLHVPAGTTLKFTQDTSRYLPL